MQLSPILPVVESHKGKAVTSSVNIAEVFKKRHRDLVKQIEEIIPQLPEIFIQRNFSLSQFTSKTGFGGLKSHKMYLLSRDAMVLLVMGFTGKEALEWKIRYIEAFNAMEEQLKAQSRPMPEAPKLANVDERRPLNNIVRLWAQKSSQNYSQCWRQVNSAFNFASVTQFPAAWIQDAVAWVQAKIDSLPVAIPAPQQEQLALSVSPDKANYGVTLSGRSVNLWEDLQHIESKMTSLSHAVQLACKANSAGHLPIETRLFFSILENSVNQALYGLAMTKQSVKTALSIKNNVDFFKV